MMYYEIKWLNSIDPKNSKISQKGAKRIPLSEILNIMFVFIKKRQKIDEDL